MDIDGLLSWSWNKIKGNKWKIWKGILLTSVIQTALTWLVALIILVAATSLSEEVALDYGNYVSRFITIPMTLGMGLYMFNFLKNGTVSVKDIFLPYKNFFKVLLCTIMFVLMITLGYLLLIVPGIILMLMFILVPFLLVYKPELGIIETFSTSYNLMKGKKGKTFLAMLIFCLLFGLLMFAGVFTLFIFYIWLMPWMYVTMYAYFLNIIDPEALNVNNFKDVNNTNTDATTNNTVANVPANFCTNCGSKLEEGSVFCSNCGNKV